MVAKTELEYINTVIQQKKLLSQRNQSKLHNFTGRDFIRKQSENHTNK